MKIDKKYVYTILPFTCFAFGYLLANLVIGNKTITTPKLTGLSIYEALKTTSPQQLNIRILSEKKSKDIPEGTIINQKPTPGRLIKAHQPIFVTTTTAPPETHAPQCTQQTYKDVERLCQEHSIKAKSYQLEFPAPSESCIAQIPQPYEIVHDKKMVLYFAKNKVNMYLMPDLTNKSLEEVMSFLESHPDTKTSIYQGSQKLEKPDESMRVVAQNPLAGSLISLQPPLKIQLKVTW